MSTKEIAIKSIQELLEDATWEQIQERINFVAGARKGFRELDEGKCISHERVKEEITEWLSSCGAISRFSRIRLNGSGVR